MSSSSSWNKWYLVTILMVGHVRLERKLLTESTKKENREWRKKRETCESCCYVFFNRFSHFGDNGTYFELFDSENDVWDDNNCANEICAHNVGDVFQTGCFEVHGCVSGTREQNQPWHQCQIKNAQCIKETGFVYAFVWN